MTRLQGRHIVLGVTGGIAAYKTPQLVRDLVSEGADVQTVLTRSAARFVGSASLQAVSGRPVRDDLWDAAAEAAMGHIELARWADAVLVAPATANFLAKLAHGLADDLLTTLCLAHDKPLALAPAMNQQMWLSAATQHNVTTLRERGHALLGPASGDQACGETGPGRMLEPAELCAAMVAHFTDSSNHAGTLAGKRVVITAGPTREGIDPVRFISNRSSGKQGYAIAAAARAAGADVTLISGPVTCDPPPNVQVVRVQSARDMYEAAMQHALGADLFIGVAAVADYRPAEQHERKLKKSERNGAELTLHLVENPDIIASVAALPAAQRPFCVGFAAETHNALDYARAKRQRKNLDAIVVNDVSDQRIGFNSDSNAATLIWEQGTHVFERQPKDQLAAGLVDQLSTLLGSGNLGSEGKLGSE